MTGHCYPIPTEIAHHCLTPKGFGEVVKVQLAGARIRPLAMIRELRGAWVVRYEFEEAIGPTNARQDALQLTLVVHPEGSL